MTANPENPNGMSRKNSSIITTGPSLVVMALILMIQTACSSLFVGKETESPDTSSNSEPGTRSTESLPAYSQTIPGSDVTIEMLPVQGGTFMMGRSTDEDGYENHEGPQRRVNVDPFWMSKHIITWEQYDLFSRELLEIEFTDNLLDEFGIEADAIITPSPPYGDEAYGMGRETDHPAVSMTHFAAVVYTMWLTAKTGKFHRLPTEAEWEYACRGGTSTTYFFGDDPSDLDEYEWYRGNSGSRYHRTGSKQPNPFGFFDMQGNVTEWTMDEYLEDYHDVLEGDVADNPWFRPESLYPRAVRGGHWNENAEDIRCTKRRGSSGQWSRSDPQIPKSMWWHTNAPFVGFRIIRPAETPSREEIMEYWIEPMLEF